MIVFGSRGSDLALTQTRLVAEALRERTGEDYEVRVIETCGDRIIDQPLPVIGGKGLFTSELEAALREGTIDAAVHSLKDLPTDDAEGLCIGAVPVRAAPHDVLVFDGACRDPEGGTLPILGDTVIGTSSPRRSAAITGLRPDIKTADIRGNVPTRVDKVRRGDYHGTILAAAGLERLEGAIEDLLDGVETVPLPVDTFTPAPGQGALAVQCREGDERVRALLQQIYDFTTAQCVHSERGLLAILGGGCSLPLGALVTKVDNGFRMQASLFGDAGAVFRIDIEGVETGPLAAIAAAQLMPLMEKSLTGHRIALLRPGSSDGRLRSALLLAGAAVEPVATSDVRVLPLLDPTSASRPVDAVAFTSERAVDRFFEETHAHGIEVPTRFFGVGTATAAAVRRRGHDCDVPPDASGGKELAEHIAKALPAGATILFPCAKDRHAALEETLTAVGITVHAMPLYEMVPIAGLELPDADLYVVTSPSAVHVLDARHDAVAFGPTTAATMREQGITPRGVAERPTIHALVTVLNQLLDELP